MLTRAPVPIPSSHRWQPPAWPDNPVDLAPGCPLAREFAAYRALQAERTVPESAQLVALRDLIEYHRQLASDPDSSAADAWSAERTLRTLQPELEDAEQQHADQQRDRLKAIIQAGHRWQQAWEHALDLRREYEVVARAQHSERVGAWHGTYGPERPSQRLVQIERDMVDLFGPHEFYAARLAQERSDAAD